MPPELTDLEHLSSLRLASCNLSGTLPPELFLLRQLAVLDVSGNKGLKGGLPDTIGWVLTELAGAAHASPLSTWAGLTAVRQILR